MRTIPAKLLSRAGPKFFQLLQKRTGWTGVQNVFARFALVERRIVNVGQQPVGRQLDATMTGGGKGFFTRKGRKNTIGLEANFVVASQCYRKYFKLFRKKY